MTKQDHIISIENSNKMNDYEKPVLTVKYFLLESNITFLSNLDPTGTDENPVVTFPTDWWS